MINLIYNPSFEKTFGAQGSGEVVVAEGWVAGHNPDYGKRPEWQPERASHGAGRVLDGDSAQKWFTTFSAHRGWIGQKLTRVTPGSLYRLTASVYVWSSEYDDANESREPGKVWVRVGINPWGDTDCEALSTATGLCYVDKYDQWITLECITRAKKAEMSVFLFSQADFAVKHNDVYWDRVRLELFDPEAPPPPPPAEGLTEDAVRRIVRSELDQTRLTFANPGVLRTLEGPWD